MKDELQNLIDDCDTELSDIESRIQELPPLDKGVRYLTNYAIVPLQTTMITQKIYA